MTVHGNERDCELPWLLNQAADLTYPVLDVGSHESTYLHALSEHGPVDGIDIRQAPGGQPLRQHFQADIRTWQAPEKYPTVVALSTIEHIGLAFDPYGTEADDPSYGDRRALEGCMRALADDGVLLLTVPYGVDEDRGWYRVYDEERLIVLLDGYRWRAAYRSDPSWEVGGVVLAEVRHR